WSHVGQLGRLRKKVLPGRRPGSRRRRTYFDRGTGFQSCWAPRVRAREGEGNEQISSDTETIAFPKIDDQRLALLKTLAKRRLAEKQTCAGTTRSVRGFLRRRRGACRLGQTLRVHAAL